MASAQLSGSAVVIGPPEVESSAPRHNEEDDLSADREGNRVSDGGKETYGVGFGGLVRADAVEGGRELAR